MRVGKDLIWHQVSSRTWYNRYLLEFLICKELINPKTILSFGCSTGEECATLQQHFPDAKITGCDINPDVLRIAKQRYPEFEFLYSDNQSLNGNKFEAIFAMNVFHRNTKSCEGLPKYERAFFDNQIIYLQSLMCKMGYLILYASDFTDPPGCRLLRTYGKLAIYEISI